MISRAQGDLITLCFQKALNIEMWDVGGSVVIGACLQARGPEFYPSDSCWKEKLREPMLSCRLSSDFHTSRVNILSTLQNNQYIKVKRETERLYFLKFFVK